MYASFLKKESKLESSTDKDYINCLKTDLKIIL